MKISLDKAINGPNPYRARATGQYMFRYIVSGTPEELAAYKKSKGEHYREDNQNKPLLFSRTMYAPGTELRLSEKSGQYFVDDAEQHIYAQACREGGAEFANLKVAEYRAASAS